jgi:hypothetical protein
MADIFAIVSKAIFEKEAVVDRKRVEVGQIWRVDRYNSANKALEPVASGGRIFLVTVRPPDEILWLVGVLENPKFDGKGWVAKANAVPVTDITELRKTMVFESGKGMSQDKGALGMSLQTPRALSAQDVAALMRLASIKASTELPVERVAVSKTAAEKPASDSPASLLASLAAAPKDMALRERVTRELLARGAIQEARLAMQGVAWLNAHDPSSLPCLCRRCFRPELERATFGGVEFFRDLVMQGSRLLFFWAPRSLEDTAPALRKTMRRSLESRVAQLARQRRQELPAF